MGLEHCNRPCHEGVGHGKLPCRPTKTLCVSDIDEHTHRLNVIHGLPRMRGVTARILSGNQVFEFRAACGVELGVTAFKCYVESNNISTI